METSYTGHSMAAGHTAKPDEVAEKAAKQRIITGWEMHLIHFRLRLTLLLVITRCYSNPLDWVRALRYLVRLRKKFLGDSEIRKMAYAGGRYYMGLYTPGWNGRGYRQFIASQLNDFKPIRGGANRLNTVFLAVTKKCTLQCEHCYEWENLNKKDILTAESISRIVARIQQSGASQVQLLGGEPLLKIDTVLQVLENADRSTDFWVVTSGFKLTGVNAAALKKAGLTGVIVSLDHQVPEKHNAFRGFRDAFYWAEEAVKNAGENNLVVALSLCATREFISEGNLPDYMELAKRWGVSFVQLLEPKPVGHYSGQEVLLQPAHIKLLEAFFIRMNFCKDYADYPIVTYHGYYQRRSGCYSAGVKGMYVDTNGDMNACPFCQQKAGNVLDGNFDGNLEALAGRGCPSYSIQSGIS